jgi:ion channel
MRSSGWGSEPGIGQAIPKPMTSALGYFDDMVATDGVFSRVQTGTVGHTRNRMIECHLLVRAMLKRDNKNVHYLTTERWRRSFREFYFPRRHTTLLGAIVLFLAVWPLFAAAAELAKMVFAAALVGLLIAALNAIQVEELVGERKKLLAERRRRKIIGWSLTGAATIERVVTLIWPSHALYLIAAVCYVGLFGFVTWEEFRAVIRQRVVSAETISMSISVYLLMGITWGLVYVFIYARHPHAFNFPGSAPPLGDTIFPTLVYFSFATISTVGFGDITPVLMQARYAAVAEGITGQFYLAILVARLVGMYMSSSRRD